MVESAGIGMKDVVMMVDAYCRDGGGGGGGGGS